MLYFQNKSVQQVAAVNPKLANKINSQGCCLTEEDVSEVMQINRMMLVLVRCGCGRFLCPVQDVKHFISIIEEHSRMKRAQGKTDGDHIRDVSFPAA